MAEAVTIGSLSAVLKKTLQTLKRPVMDAAKQYSVVREKLSDLAPRVMKLFTQIQADHEGISFVDFVRMFDETVPTHAADRNGETGYRNHRTYYTLSYMRRIVQTGGRQRRGTQGVRDTATDGLARAIATVLQVVADPEQVWKAVQAESGYTERLMNRLRKRVAETKPFIKLTASKPIRVGNVVHMAPRQPEAAEPLRQPGRAVVLPAPAGRKRAAA